ncbi:hypothetical protein I4U23_021837 [Adineta vaga]|nr:hypothetical protein I4U23_021837 [Adineta vaga]
MASENDLISSLTYATMQINRHAATLLLLFGTLGNLLNICVLSEHSFQENSCSFYLSWSSITSLIFIWSGFLTRILQGYNINWPNQNSIACKTRQFFLNVSWPMGIWCLVGANIDRYLCSHHSVTYRQLSTNKMAKRFVFGIFIFFCLLFIEVIYCFEGSIPNVPVLCYGQNIPCRLFNDWAALLFDIILPSICLAIFGTLTIRNIQSTVVRPIIINSENRNNNRLTMRHNDRNLSRMLLIQVLFVLILDLPFGIYRTYASLTSNISKSSYRILPLIFYAWSLANDGQFPKDTQIVALLLFIHSIEKGLLEQIRTGEGKTHVVDLAIEGEQKCRASFQLLKLESGHICHGDDDEVDHQSYRPDLNTRQGNIVHGEVGAFQKDILEDEFNNKNIYDRARIMREDDHFVLDATKKDEQKNEKQRPSSLLIKTWMLNNIQPVGVMVYHNF